MLNQLSRAGLASDFNSKVFKTENEYPRYDDAERSILPAECAPTCCYAAAERKVFKLSFEYLYIYSPNSGDFCEKSNKIPSLMRCQMLGLQKTLTCSQSRDLEDIQ